MNKFKVGTKVFIIESNKNIREGQVVKVANVFYIVKFSDAEGAIRLKESRFYESRKEAEHVIGIEKETTVPAKSSPLSPYTYEL